MTGLVWMLSVWAQVRITASAPETVVAGEQFRLSFTVNTSKTDGFKAPAMSGFEVLMGPSTSTQSSFQMINGKTTQSSSVTYTYILMANEKGKFTIPPATVEVDGKQYASNRLEIEVLPPDKTSSGSGSSGSSSGSSRMHTQQAGSEITGKDLFIQVTADKKKVYEQEAVLLTYKVYSLVNLSQLAGNMPDLDGFHTQEIPLPQQKSMKLEHYNGRNYGTVVWRQYLLFPQRTGKLTVPAIKFEGIVVQQNTNIDPFDAFFGGGNRLIEVKKTIEAPSITLQVEPLPERPDNFSGAVGQFSIASELTPRSLKANEAINMKVTVTGTGNMKLLGAPEVKFPKDFEAYKPKVTDDTKLQKGGASGSKTFDYVAVPRHAGKYQVPPVEFCYFDPKAGTYKTIRTEAYEVEVARGSGRGAAVANYTDKEDLKLLNSDIRYIKTAPVRLRPLSSAIYFATYRYALSYVVLLLLFVLLLVIYRKKAIENANVMKMKGKKASKVATKRLKLAQKLLAEHKTEAFYDETLKALWGYVGDKLAIPVAELNKDNIKERLEARQVASELSDTFIEVLNDCEFARFAPGDPDATMDKIYDEAVRIISELENAIKK